MKIVTVVGARPQFIKAAAVSRELRKENQEILIHTGQHYDNNMSDIFFSELQIPQPDYNLSVGSDSHARQTATILIGIEDILFQKKPDFLMVYGDTNSTLAGALAASKIHIPIIHIEAGLRSFNMRMPEEQNRILTDRISRYLFCPTDTAVANLKSEGINQGVYNVGDVMCDALLFYSKSLDNHKKEYYFDRLQGLFTKTTPPDSWYLATIHRAENTDTILKVSEILKALERLDVPVIFPVHPRIKSMIQELNQDNGYQNILFVEPIGYMDMLYFTKYAQKIITDSGGLQKEAYILDTPCVTVRDQTEWIETLNGNHNVLAKPEASDILEKVRNTLIDTTNKEAHYGDGTAAKKICTILNGEKK